MFPAAFNLASLNGTNGFFINGSGDDGWVVNILKDINGDSIDDILVSSPHYESSVGQVYIIYGSKTFPVNINLSNLNGSNSTLR